MSTPERDPKTAAFSDVGAELGMSALLPKDDKFSFLESAIDPGDLGRLAQYRVLRLLGAGGMGYVFEAEDTHLTRRVALKVMRPEYATDLNSRERFLVEARAAAGLSSDYIVTVYQVGMAGDVPFQAIQLLTGESLQDRLQREAPLSIELATVILRQVAEGLAVAHEKGLIHRDIKPANIWLESLRPGGPFRRARILDFGLARSNSCDTKLTATGIIVGTPHFMAPEQASGQAVDGRSDLFSLGCVAYSMLTGEMAFDGSSTMAVLMALATHTPPDISHKNPTVPTNLALLVSAMMAKNPAHRPSSAASLCTALDAILNALPASLRGLDQPSGVTKSPTVLPPSPSTDVNVAGPTTVAVGGTPAPPVAARRWWTYSAGALSLVAVAIALFAVFGKFGRDGAGHNPEGPPPGASGEPILVGILHSTTGTMAISESPVVDATLLAIDEINETGGVLGRPLEPVVMNGESDPDKFARAAEKMLVENKVAAIFGCWTSASRKAVRPVVERHNSLLFYPVQYEGLEQSPRVVYLGPAPNQQLLPAIDFLVQRQGKKRLFLIGSDYVFPHAAHEIVKDAIKVKKSMGVEIVGETFLPLGSKDVAKAIASIKAAAPDTILNTINGTTNYHFFQALNDNPATAGISVMSVSMMESDVRRLETKGIAGDFLAGTYFEGVNSASGNAFMMKFRKRFGPERRFADPLAAAYSGVHLWAKAANASKSLEPEAVVKSLRGLTFGGPVGEVKIDAENLHCWLPVRMGRIRPDGGVESVEVSNAPIRPEPFPTSRTRAEWDLFLNSLFLKWDGHWQAPGP